MNSLADRFWAKCDRKGEDECWDWEGSIQRENPRFKVHGRWVAAHKVAWYLHTGEDMYDSDIRRTCGNRLCVNPHHLAVVQRAPRTPTAHHYSSHTPLMRRARNMRIHAALLPYLENRYVTEGATIRELAAELDVSTGTVARWLHQFSIPVRPRGPRRVSA